MNDRISIIIPAYNTANFIGKALDSLISQTYQNIEVICVDDGSTDNTFDVLKQYAEKDSRIKVFTQENGGPGKARNTALSYATGKYIMFCDSDDWYEPTMCAEMEKAITQNDCDVAMCQTRYEFQEGCRNKEENAKLRGITEKYYNPSHIDSNLDKSRFCVNVLLWNKIFKRELIDKYQIRFLEHNDHDDNAFWYSYSLVAKNIFYTPKKLYHYLIRQNSIMDNFISKNPINTSSYFFVAQSVFYFLINYNLLKENEKYIIRICNHCLSQEYPLLTTEEIKSHIKYFNDCFLENSIHGFFALSSKGVVLISERISKLKLFFNYIKYNLKILIYCGKKNKKYRRKLSDVKFLLENYEIVAKL